MASDPNGINYPSDPELRKNLANEIEKVLDKNFKGWRSRSEHSWADYTKSVVDRLKRKL